MYIEVRSRTIQIKRERNNSVNSQSVNKSEKKKEISNYDLIVLRKFTTLIKHFLILSQKKK